MSKHQEASARLQAFIAPAFKELSIAVTPAQLEEIIDLVSGSMSGEGRFFHNPEHVIHVGSGGDALSTLAAFFHDLVYFQVDQGVSLNVARHIAPFVNEKESALSLRPETAFAQAPFALAVMSVFGFAPGQTLPSSGQNEFLSALAAASVLSPFTNLSHIVQIAACIEATIPFRKKIGNKTAADRLLDRVKATDKQWKLGFSQKEFSIILRRAVKMANQDVSNFGGESATRFLKNTWELVPEINPMLRSPAGYSVDGYREALQKMERFFTNLDPQAVFQRFDAEPSEEEYAALTGNAAARIEEARYYFRLKLISLGMLEALSGTLGKNLGLPILMGELSNLGSFEDRVEKFLPVLDGKNTRGDEMEIRLLRLLEKNAEQEAEVGLKSSPLTAFLLRIAGLKPLLKMWPLTEEFFKDQGKARDFLEAVPGEAVGLVSDAISVLLQRRAHRISTFVGSLATPET